MENRVSPIKARLDELGQTQTWLARETGMADATISRLLRFGENLSKSRAKRIGRALGVPWTALWAAHHDADPETAEFALLMEMAPEQVRQSVLHLLRASVDKLP